MVEFRLMDCSAEFPPRPVSSVATADARAAAAGFTGTTKITTIKTT
ncbi:MAG: hypothetical protein ABI886_12560 [Betaproteobacteria bacterium]